MCYYVEYPNPGDYSCILNIVNPSGHEFAEITGNHLSGMTNTDVTGLEAAGQSSRIIPAIFCDEFTNLQLLDIHSSEIQRLTADSFRNCRNLRTIMLNNNQISTIGGDVLSGLESLEHFEVQLNLIHTVAPSAFSGTSVATILLGGNRLRELSVDHWFGVETTLQTLHLFENNLAEIDENLFDSLANLEELDLGINPGIRVPPNTFRTLSGLRMLFLDNSEIERIEPEWFTSK